MSREQAYGHHRHVSIFFYGSVELHGITVSFSVSFSTHLTEMPNSLG